MPGRVLHVGDERRPQGRRPPGGGDAQRGDGRGRLGSRFAEAAEEIARGHQQPLAGQLGQLGANGPGRLPELRGDARCVLVIVARPRQPRKARARAAGRRWVDRESSAYTISAPPPAGRRSTSWKAQ